MAITLCGTISIKISVVRGYRDNRTQGDKIWFEIINSWSYLQVKDDELSLDYQSEGFFYKSKLI